MFTNAENRIYAIRCHRSPMFRWEVKPLCPAGALLSPLLLGAVCWGQIRVTSIAYDTVRLPCTFPFIQGVENLLVVWQKVGKDGENVQIYKSLNGQPDLSNQDSQFRGRTVFSGDISQGKLDLTLVGVTWRDDAVYYCRAANKINHGDNEVVLSVSALPPQMVKRAVEDYVTLVPKFSGVPTEINWKLNSNKVVDMELEPLNLHFYRLSDRADLQRNGSLTIRNLTKEDSGAYKSEALVDRIIQENEIHLTVFDRVSKPTISDSSTDQQIILHCVSSTIDVSYKWTIDGRETNTTDPEYIAQRPQKDVNLSCTVHNTLSEDSQSITILYSSVSGRHHFITAIFLSFIVVLTLITIILVFSFKRYWKFKKNERDGVQPTTIIAYSPSNGKNRPAMSENGSLYDANGDKRPIEGFQKIKEDKRDAAELRDTGYHGLLKRVYKLSDSDYYSDQDKAEAPESGRVLEER